MTRTVAFLIGCTALISGALPTCAAGLVWKVLSPQSVKEPEVCFYASANVDRANGLPSVWTKCRKLALNILESNSYTKASSWPTNLCATKNHFRKHLEEEDVLITAPIRTPVG